MKFINFFILIIQFYNVFYVTEAILAPARYDIVLFENAYFKGIKLVI